VHRRYHFALLMVVVFCFFAYTSQWMFGSYRNDFKDLRASLQAMFEVCERRRAGGQCVQSNPVLVMVEILVVAPGAQK